MSEENNICKESAYQKLYHSTANKIRNFMLYKCGSLELAEDLCHEAFLRAWKNCAKITPDKAAAFLYRVANNLVLDKVKHDKVVFQYKFQVKKSIEHESPEYQLEMKDFKTQLDEAISSLPEKERVVFLMSRIDKMTYKEIAEKLGLSVKAIEKRMQLALRAMRKMKFKI
mgnify:CR=1 FL=1